MNLRNFFFAFVFFYPFQPTLPHDEQNRFLMCCLRNDLKHLSTNCFIIQTQI